MYFYVHVYVYENLIIIEQWYFLLNVYVVVRNQLIFIYRTLINKIFQSAKSEF